MHYVFLLKKYEIISLKRNLREKITTLKLTYLFEKEIWLT